MRYPALEYQPGIAAEQAEPARAAPGTPNRPSRPSAYAPATACRLDTATSISVDQVAQHPAHGEADGGGRGARLGLLPEQRVVVAHRLDRGYRRPAGHEVAE